MLEAVKEFRQTVVDDPRAEVRAEPIPIYENTNELGTNAKKANSYISVCLEYSQDKTSFGHDSG